MKDFSWARVILILFILLGPSCRILNAQDRGDISGYILLAKNDAERLVSQFVEPIADGLLYGVSGGWYHSARVQEKWGIDVSFVTNGTFVPSEKTSFVLVVSDYDNLRLENNVTSIRLPTIIGKANPVGRLVATLKALDYPELLEDVDIPIDIPRGIDFLQANLLPSAFLQVGLGLPAGFELRARYFPKLTVSDVQFGMYGLGVQHEFTRWFRDMDNEKFTLSALISYTNLMSDYEFDADGVISGTGEKVSLEMNSYLFTLIASTRFEVYNLYGGFGYVQGDSDLVLKGTYSAVINEQEILTVTNPFKVSNNVSGLRVNLGASVRMGRLFFMNADYTFQGYNNVSLGLKFNIL